MAWNRPLMTDSGGFQVFSLGFGRDFGLGKLSAPSEEVRLGAQPQRLRITDAGVHFCSPIDGRALFIGPNESMKIQAAIGADIAFAFDECTPPAADEAYTANSLLRTHQWAKDSLRFRNKQQALYGIVQGGRFAQLRKESAATIGALPFDGFAIGGEFGGDKRAMDDMIRFTLGILPSDTPRHLLGIGHPEDFFPVITAGIDTFDCIAPTHYARRGIAFVTHGLSLNAPMGLAMSPPNGRLDLRQAQFLRDPKPLDPRCACATCATYSRAYIAHLLRAHEITALRLLTFHNLFFFHATIARLRDDIQRGRI
jgi:queuine tRNA-ribosyltransferase/7-cyano-7-deazaguanine tRNA-ribosyltransferase